jgi:hypothetical protein
MERQQIHLLIIIIIIMESDMHAVSVNIHNFKFADDTNLLVPENSKIAMQEEFINLQDYVR